MQNKISLILILILIVFKEQSFAWDAETPLSTVLKSLGDIPVDHALEYTEELAKRGKDIALKGQTVGPDGKLSKMQSVYFVCTDCHNLVREDPALRFSDPTTRLSYAKKNNLKFLPGTTLYGLVNRASWFNDSYLVLYGDLVVPANNNLKEAIQVCSEVCSSGRRLEKWEMDSLMAYFWNIELKLGDLNLSKKDWETLKLAEENPDQFKKLIPWLKDYYFNASPATFAEPPMKLSKGFRGLSGDPNNGETIYQAACLHCHSENGPSYYKLDLNLNTIRNLYENRLKHNQRSFYIAIRNGIYFKYIRPYMPQYTFERMSDQQIEDLKAYLKKRVDVGN